MPDLRRRGGMAGRWRRLSSTCATPGTWSPASTRLSTSTCGWLATMTDLTLTAALDLHAAGCPVRASIDGTKTPLGAWNAYHDPAHRPTVDQLNGWFGNGHAGIGIITGAASGKVEMLEFEGCAVAKGVLTSWGELMDAPGLGDIKPQLMTGYLDATPTGVLHLHYRIDGKPVPGNTKPRSVDG
jgi:hypothetical protein